MNVGTVLCQEEILIIGEGRVMLSFSAADQLKALKALISFYYALHFCYPKACFNTFTFKNTFSKSSTRIILPRILFLFLCNDHWDTPCSFLNWSWPKKMFSKQLLSFFIQVEAFPSSNLVCWKYSCLLSD